MSIETLNKSHTHCHDFFDGFVPHTTQTDEFLQEQKRQRDILALIGKLQKENHRTYTNPGLVEVYRIIDAREKTSNP